jgi:hypothetical protein
LKCYYKNKLLKWIAKSRAYQRKKPLKLEDSLMFKKLTLLTLVVVSSLAFVAPAQAGCRGGMCFRGGVKRHFYAKKQHKPVAHKGMRVRFNVSLHNARRAQMIKAAAARRAMACRARAGRACGRQGVGRGQQKRRHVAAKNAAVRASANKRTVGNAGTKRPVHRKRPVRRGCCRR